MTPPPAIAKFHTVVLIDIAIFTPSSGTVLASAVLNSVEEPPKVSPQIAVHKQPCPRLHFLLVLLPSFQIHYLRSGKQYNGLS